MNSSFNLLVLVTAICLVNSSAENADLILEDTGEDKSPNSLSAQNSKKLISASKNQKFGQNLSFQDYKTLFRKSFKSTRDEEVKKTNFAKNKKNLEKANCSPCGVNNLFDRSEEQLQSLLGTLLEVRGNQTKLGVPIFSIQSQLNNSLSKGARLLATVPSSFDWRNYNAVTPVRNQGLCGGCWAFGAAQFLQSEMLRRKLTTDKTIHLSEQFLLKCHPFSFGCSGGYSFNATYYAIEKGMPLYSTYPYLGTTSYVTTMCAKPIIGANFNKSDTMIGSTSTLKSSDETMINYLMQRPLLLGVNANDFVNYSPTSTNKILKCSQTNSNGTVINHSVLLVGYRPDAWIVKNSWGTNWGLSGYVLVTRNQSHSCNIGNYWGTFSSVLPWVV